MLEVYVKSLDAVYLYMNNLSRCVYIYTIMYESILSVVDDLSILYLLSQFVLVVLFSISTICH